MKTEKKLLKLILELKEVLYLMPLIYGQKHGLEQERHIGVRHLVQAVG